MRLASALVSLLAGCAGMAACARPPPRAPEWAGASTLQTQGVHLLPGAPVQGARLVPLTAEADASLGVEPGGGARGLPAGVRVVSHPGGAIEAASDRLGGSHWRVTPLPERLGGGFLFQVDDRQLWRSDRWLGPLRPIYTAPSIIGHVIAGLDRVYVFAGSWRAIDGTTGETLPLGPWPSSPTVGAYAAADGWRALAVTDLRGALATFDAGATWRPLRLPLDPREVTSRGDLLEVKGIEPGRGEAAYDVRADGQIFRVPEVPRSPTGLVETSTAEPSGALGAHPLLAAVEDGWPLDDGTAVVARDGALARVRLSDGELVEIAPGAYPLRPSRCHAIPLGASPGTPGSGVGFVCGEPRGATILYSFDPAAGRLEELRRFDAPRAVLSSGNGAIAVRGSCEPKPAPDSATAHPYCVRNRDGAWHEIRIEGTDGAERVTVLADGRLAVLSPPQGSLEAARLTIVEGAQAHSVPITFPRLSEDVLRVLDLGVWLDGFEERRPGILGGWIEAAGAMLGIEIDLKGDARVGPFVRDAGLPMVSGRYGLGWTASRRGYETTDGGMTWTPLDVPEPIAAPRAVSSRACGPVGCSAAGWLRVGWGKTAEESAPLAPPPPAPLPVHSYVSALLDCSANEPWPAPVTPPKTPFVALAPPPSSAEDRVLAYDISEILDRAARLRAVARVYAWGPKSGEWEHAAKWMVRWEWPFGAAADIHSTVPAPAPGLLWEAARAGSGLSMALPFLWNVAIGDDASHALLIARKSARSDVNVFELDADRAPLEIRRADGEPFGEIDSALRTQGRWYIATSPAGGEGSDAVVWQVEGPIARELARIPRAAPLTRVSPGHLAARSDGRELGYVVEGQPANDRTGPTRWVAAIDPESGAVGEVASLGPLDLGDRRSVPVCGASSDGWTLDAPVTFPISLSSQGGPLGALHGAFARLRLDPSHACIERLAGTLEERPSSGAIRHTQGEPEALPVALSVGNERRLVRCSAR
ncbi:MAG TPA: hypothetical protein VGI39_08315 [Polyangiaceae bacterium]